ncbi:MAG TPA: DMT family transporter [Alphaproteobacteria bacterium]|nr:DMT family transporter [Alphaproteobacteria bacterium]
MSGGPLPTLAAAAVGVQVGAAMVATRYVIDETSPATLALLRYAIGLVCLIPPLLATARPRFAARDIVPIAVLGVIQFGLLIAALNYGLKFVPAARGALIFATFPLLTMLLAAAFRLERMTPAKTLGVTLSIVGVGMTLSETAFAASSGASEWIGALAVLASAFMGALCSILYRPYLRKYPTLPVSALAMAASVVFLMLPAAAEGAFAAAPRFSPGGWAAVAFIGVSSGVGYYVWLWALAHATPTRVTVFLSLSPVTASVLGVVLLGEELSPLALAGVAAVVLGLWVAHWRGGEETARSPAPGPT